MHKIFKIERIGTTSEFKRKDRLALTKRKRTRHLKKAKSSLCEGTRMKLIRKQTQLHNEEKELFQKRDRPAKDDLSSSLVDGKAIKEVNEADAKKVELIDTIETNESLVLGNQPEGTPQETNPMNLISAMDQGIIQSLQFNDFVYEDLQRVKKNGPRNLLPPATKDTPEYCLVLDLDETLVHCSVTPFEGYDEVLNNIYISYRPFLLEFLEKASQFFEVVMFTASESAYANMVVDRFDPEQKYIHHRLFRESCLKVYGNYIKDLNVLGRDLNKTMIVDNSMVSFILNLDSAIPIESYQGSKQDIELYRLMELMANAIDSHSTSTNKTSDETEPLLNLKEHFASIFRMEDRFSFWRQQMNTNFEGLGIPFSN
ncbi:unnamed protein product [Moneuplotes crassus]|uniref:FCP1 homology domain-containing protein n=1 Tax=Euplotes crassus TaxID=5936 RepID=A0AAD1X8B7_EUPCR|nr:unnamed protein product [Moneuplotes crassus]